MQSEGAKQKALVVTFYAFKGGTGRTLALANVARLLADEMGYRVGLVDLDIESPGLVHEPLCASLESGSGERRRLLRAIDDGRGFLECFVKRAKSRDPEARRPIGLSDEVHLLDSGSGGSLLLMPTATGSVLKTRSFERAVDEFNHTLSGMMTKASHADEDASGTDTAAKITWEIFSEFINRYKLDFLFVDGRTGAGSFSPVYVDAIPHLLVLFFGLNDQNISGSLSALRHQGEFRTTEAPAMLVASPVPTVGPGALEERLQFVSAQLAEIRKERDSTPERNFIYKAPQRIGHFLPYSDAAAYGEVYFPNAYPNSLLSHAYRKLARDIEALVVTDLDAQSATKDSRHSLLPASPLVSNVDRPVQIVVEDVHGDVFRVFKSELGDPDVRSFAYEHSRAPWQKLLNPKNGRRNPQDKPIAPAELDGILREMPDVLMLPQSMLKVAAAVRDKDNRPLLHDLSALRHLNHRAGSQPMHFDFLDLHYPNWRGWATVDQRVIALPFSVNATLLCANDVLLARACAEYWRSHVSKVQPSFFVPSNWHLLTDLLKSNTKNKGSNADLYRIVGSKKGLYYDWLSFVATMGGFDLIQTEGGLIEEVRLGTSATIEATKLFVELARLSETSKKMGEQIESFAHGKLALYTGWTDSFRFEWGRDGRPSAIRPTPLSDGQAVPAAISDHIRLARNPRDMRVARTCLVDGWLMTFPNKTLGLESALQFAGRFLDPDLQGQMLRAGFPSASGSVVKKELELFRAGRRPVKDATFVEKAKRANAEASYRVFLETMEAAIFSGHWVASPDGAIADWITEAIERLVDRADMMVEEQLGRLADRVSQEIRRQSNELRKGYSP